LHGFSIIGLVGSKSAGSSGNTGGLPTG